MFYYAHITYTSVVPESWLMIFNFHISLTPPDQAFLGVKYGNFCHQETWRSQSEYLNSNPQKMCGL